MGGPAELLTLLLLLVSSAVCQQKACPDTNEIACGQDRCIPYRYICDNDSDCGATNEDEDQELCQAWKNNHCNRGQVKCFRNGEESCTNIQEYCAENSGCLGDLDPRICVMIREGTIKPLASIQLEKATDGTDLDKTEHLAKEFVHLLNQTIQHPRCPTMFTDVGDQCIAFFFIGSVSWGEARAFCQVLGGDLITFRDVSHYTTVVSHLQETQLTVDFWVGGSFANESDGWRWLDDTPVEMGTPFWAVRYNDKCSTRNVTFEALNLTRTANHNECYSYQQAPDDPVRGRCVGLQYEHYYYMTDEDCVQKKSPLCVLTDGPAAADFGGPQG